jgi:hypothetical protein
LPYALDALCSCFDSHTSAQNTFESVGSSEEETSMQSTIDLEKQPSFNHIVTHTIEPKDKYTDYVYERDIDDGDNDSEWKTDSDGECAVGDDWPVDDDWEGQCTFERTYQTKFNDHISLLTLALGKCDNHAPQSPPAINSSRTSHPPLWGASPSCDDGPLMMKDIYQPTPKSTTEAPRSSAQPIAAPTAPIPIQAALSPRTTRQNMLETELTESLRRQLLLERQQKSSTANAVLKHRHTSHDVANLKQFPGKVCMKGTENMNASSCYQVFDPDNYHSKGW